MPSGMQENSRANLKPFQDRPKKELIEISKKGAKARAENCRQRKTMRELMNILLSLPASKKDKTIMKTMGITNNSDQNNKMLVAVGLLKRAATGDPRAVETLCGISGDIFTIPKDREDDDTREEQLNNLKDFEVVIVDASKNGGKNV